MEKKRRKFSGSERVAILRRHLVEKIPVSDLCDELGLHPNVFYQWQKKFFENGAAAFERRSKGETRKLQEKISATAGEARRRPRQPLPVRRRAMPSTEYWPWAAVF